MRPHVRFVALVGAALTTLGASLPAAAYPEAPGILQEELELNCLPSCLLCHTRPEGGKGYTKEGTAEPMPGNRGYGNFLTNLIFAGGMPARLPTEDNLVSYVNAFKTVPCGGTTNTMNTQGQPCNSDGDAKTDLEELKLGTDPDVPDVAGPYSCVTPQYGCGASIQALPRDESALGHAVALMTALGVGLVLVRRARR
jgi:hypothetical protein